LTTVEQALSRVCPRLGTEWGHKKLLEVYTMGKGSHHVVHNTERGGWDVRKGGSERSSGHCDHKQDAIDIAREISRNQGAELIVHNQDGKFAWRDSHGNDPYPPKG